MSTYRCIGVMLQRYVYEELTIRCRKVHNPPLLTPPLVSELYSFDEEMQYFRDEIQYLPEKIEYLREGLQLTIGECNTSIARITPQTPVNDINTSRQEKHILSIGSLERQHADERRRTILRTPSYFTTKMISERVWYSVPLYVKCIFFSVSAEKCAK